ncbi:MAG: transcription elongation factor GreB [Myxococcota bacterium]|jgi:transcription elongation factor GreB
MTDFLNYITPRGFKRLRDEHSYLRLVDRPHVVDEVARAAAMGDRSENAEYIYGKKRLREIDRRLRWLDKRIRPAEIIEPSTDRGETIFFGATVTLGYPDGAEKVLDLIGEDEIESEIGRISWCSPVGRTILRKKEGDYVLLQHLGHAVEIEIVEVTYRPQVPDPPTRWDIHQTAKKAAKKAAEAKAQPKSDS